MISEFAILIVLHRMREALPKRRQVRQGAGLLQEGAARPPPEKLPLLPPRQGAGGVANAAAGENQEIVLFSVCCLVPSDIQKLPFEIFIVKGNVEFKTEREDVYATCPVQVMKEIEDDLVDAPCGEMTLHGHAGYCK